MSNYNKEYYQKNKDKIKQRVKEYRLAHLESERTYHAKYLKQRRIDHKNHLVYSLTLPDGRVYIGSCNFISDRMARHRYTSKVHPDWPLYVAVRDAGGWDNVTLAILKEHLPDKSMRLEYEQAYLDKVPARLSLNVHRAVRE